MREKKSPNTRSGVQSQQNYNYREAIKRMLDLNQVRLIVNLDDLRDYDRTYADGYVSRRLLDPSSCGVFDEAITE
jgi:DNA replication licensing factor MCM3